ncbi:MAG: S9 family peptidase, partial [Mesorhizobium sp.]
DRRRQRHELIRLDVNDSHSEVVFEEADERLNLRIWRSDSGAWLLLDVMDNAGAVEVWCLPADQPGVGWRRIVARDLGHHVFAEHWGDRF